MPLGAADMSADSDTLLYTVPAGKKASVNVSLCARTQAALVRLALTSGGAPADTDYLEYDTPLAARGVLERTQIWMTAGEKLYARASETGVTAIVYGPVEDV